MNQAQCWPKPQAGRLSFCPAISSVSQTPAPMHRPPSMQRFACLASPGIITTICLTFRKPLYRCAVGLQCRGLRILLCPQTFLNVFLRSQTHASLRRSLPVHRFAHLSPPLVSSRPRRVSQTPAPRDCSTMPQTCLHLIDGNSSARRYSTYCEYSTHCKISHHHHLVLLFVLHLQFITAESIPKWQHATKRLCTPLDKVFSNASSYEESQFHSHQFRWHLSHLPAQVETWHQHSCALRIHCHANRGFDRPYRFRTTGHRQPITASFTVRTPHR